MNPDILTTEETVLAAGLEPLSGEELERRMFNKTILGEFGYAFIFIVCIERDGSMEGKNNAGAHHFGKCSIDKVNNTVTVQWDSGWEASTTRAYDVGGKIKLYDFQNGNWRTTFTAFSDGCTQPLTLPNS